MDSDSSYLYMDVGGGSTELTLFNNHEAIASQSFNVGSIRLLMNSVPNEQWSEMKEWVRGIGRQSTKNLALIGSGGNINKYCKLLMKDYGEALKYDEIYHLYKRLKHMSTE